LHSCPHIATEAGKKQQIAATDTGQVMTARPRRHAHTPHLDLQHMRQHGKHAIADHRLAIPPRLKLCVGLLSTHVQLLPPRCITAFDADV
jgi:hypothetical protein